MSSLSRVQRAGSFTLAARLLGDRRGVHPEHLSEKVSGAFGDQAFGEASIRKQKVSSKPPILVEDLPGRRTEGPLHADSGDSSEIHAATVVEQDQVRCQTPSRIRSRKFQNVEQNVGLSGLANAELDLGWLELEQEDGLAHGAAQAFDLERVVSTRPKLIGIVVVHRSNAVQLLFGLRGIVPTPLIEGGVRAGRARRARLADRHKSEDIDEEVEPDDGIVRRNHTIRGRWFRYARTPRQLAVP